MDTGRVILDETRFQLTLERLCLQLIEEYDDFRDTALIGIQAGGIPLCDRITERLSELGVPQVRYGKLDITFYRDDFRTRTTPLAASKTQMDFLVEGLRVVLVDDVVYTGRTIQAALTALNHYGRPQSVRLLSMIDRRFNRHLPIQPNFSGLVVDALDEAYVRVEWAQDEGRDQVLLFANQDDNP
jgi:pyrimidine operon attenuation protein / uracil phosphoribosyltransferase